MPNFSKYYIIAIFFSAIFIMYSLVFDYYPYNIVIAVFAIGYIALNIIRIRKEKEYIRVLKGDGAYCITYDELPTDRLLVGRGFLWTVEDTAQVTDLMKNKEMLAEGESLGGLSFLHGIGMDREINITVPLADLVGHSIYMGTTRVGKTRGFELPIVQAIKRGETTIIIDPKGDRELLNRTYEACLKYRKQEDFIFFSLVHPKHSASYNPLQNFTLPNEIPDRISALLPSGGDSDAFKSFAWQVISAITNALLYLEIKPTIKNLYEYSLSKTSELCILCIKEAFNRKALSSVIENIDDDDEVDGIKVIARYIKAYKKVQEVQSNMIDDLLVIAMHPREHFQKMIASLTPVLKKLSDGEIGDLLSQSSSDISWERVTNKKKVVYMMFGSLQLQETAKAIAKATVQDFTSFVGAKYSYDKTGEEKEPINLFIDEFSEVVSEYFANFLNKCGGAGVRVTLASQSAADIEAVLKSAAKSQQIFDCLNNKLWMRVADMATAKVFADAAGPAAIKQQLASYSVTPDVGHEDVLFKSSYSKKESEKVAPLIEPSWIMKLPKGQGFLLSQGRVFKVRMPLLVESQKDYFQDKGVLD